VSAFNPGIAWIIIAGISALVLAFVLLWEWM
jgi:hypothetical protein